MSQRRERTVQCLSPAGFHDMAYGEWGDRENPRVLVCVHGLTRCSRDFDFLAEALAGHYRVVCPDVVGRGRSARLRDPRHYTVPQYCSDMATLLARLDAGTVHWLGTSMGGLIGMALAAQPETPIRRLVLNDVGPVVTGVSLARIGQYLGSAPRFSSLAAAQAYVRAVSAPFGQLTDGQWRHLTEHAVRQAGDGQFEFIYDPGIAEPFRQAMGDSGDVDLWPLYESVACPTLVLRGAESDLLTAETAAEMTRRGPRASLVEIPGVGHAPVLMNEDQIAIVREFLLG